MPGMLIRLIRMLLHENEPCPTCGRTWKGAYDVWIGIKSRCLNPNAPGYQNYGGRGIKMCERWQESYQAFVDDVGDRPSARHTLDRINNDGDYEPGNVRWATYGEQRRNMRNNVWIEWNGERMIAPDWAKRLGISTQSMSYRLRHWPLEEAMTRPPQDGHRVRNRA